VFKDPPHSKIAEPFWDGLRNDQFMFQHCSDCERSFYYPSSHCDNCWSTNLQWIAASGTGTVETFTEVFRPFSSEFDGDVPYTVLFVQLDEGPRVVTWLTKNSNIQGGDVPAIGARGKFVFERINDHTTLHRFEILSNETQSVESTDVSE
jgi:uncharacterized protein